MEGENTTVVRIHTHVDSDTITLSDMGRFSGKDVEITVREGMPAPRRDLTAFFEAAKDVPVDLDSIMQLREASKI